jgi:hypothetical protein
LFQTIGILEATVKAQREIINKQQENAHNKFSFGNSRLISKSNIFVQINPFKSKNITG